MALSRGDIVVELTHLGDGQVIATGSRDRPSEDLLLAGAATGTDPSLIRAPLSPSARNLRLLDGTTQLRPGYAALAGTKPASASVTGAFQALFDNGTTALLRFAAATVHSYVAGTYTGITAASPPTGGATDFWDAAMVRRAGSVTPGNQVFATNGVAADFIYAWTGTGAMTRVNGTDAPRGVKSLSFFGEYAFAGNVVDALGDRRNQRIQRSSVLDPLVWNDINNGAGFVDLRQDPYPIAKLTVLAGNQIVMKGNEQGGAFYGGIETGRITEPVEYQLLNYGVGIGLLLPRAFLLLEPALAWFVAHNGIYVWDGRSAPQRVMDNVTKAILRRLNYNALNAAFAAYYPATDEIVLHIPTGSSTTATEAWVWNRRENRTYGPWVYGHALTCFTLRAESGALTWSKFDYPGGWSTIPFATWSAITGGAKGALAPVYGTSAGDLMSIGDGEGALTSDDGVAIAATYTTATVSAGGRAGAGAGASAPLSFHDALVLHEVSLRYRSDVAWTPVVRVSIDGGNSFVTVSDGAVLAAGGIAGELREKCYVATALPGLAAARSFIVNIDNVAGGALPAHSLRLRFAHGGDLRAMAAG